MKKMKTKQNIHTNSWVRLCSDTAKSILGLNCVESIAKADGSLFSLRVLKLQRLQVSDIQWFGCKAWRRPCPRPVLCADFRLP